MLWISSFMIVAQPHFGVNPVTVYDRAGNGKYKMKISVMIVSLLHDFIETHPELITIENIGNSCGGYFSLQGFVFRGQSPSILEPIRANRASIDTVEHLWTEISSQRTISTSPIRRVITSMHQTKTAVQDRCEVRSETTSISILYSSTCE